MSFLWSKFSGGLSFPFLLFQGMTIKPLVRILHVKLRGKEQRSMYAELNEKVFTKSSSR